MSKLQHTLEFSTEARKKLKVGIDKLADAVCVTLGPKGRNVVIEREWGFPTITKDGVTVANEVYLEDKFEKLGSSIGREGAVRTAEEVGDKTTGCITLMREIINEGLKQVEAGISPIEIKKQIEDRGKEIIEGLKKMAKKISNDKQVEQVASISANDEKIGKIVADTLKKVGKDGMIISEVGNKIGTEVEITNGYSFERGPVSPYFFKDKIVMEEANIVIAEKLSSADDIIPILQKYEKKDLLIIAEDIDGDALKLMVLNKRAGALNCVGVKAPEYGEIQREMLDDIRCIIGAKENEGQAKVIVKNNQTIIIGGKNPKPRIERIKKQLKEASQFEKLGLSKRMAKLKGGMAIIRVGAPTEMETNEIKDRIDDCIGATKSAIEEGILPGGGVSLVKLATKDTILDKAILKPAKQIAENAGKDGSEVVYKIKETGLGYNAKTDKFEDLMEAGVIDSLKAERVALENAISVATMFLTIGCVILKEEKSENISIL